jgi:hypothetical protein
VLLVQARSKAWATRRVGTPAVQTVATPTLRKVREGWGTLVVASAGEIKSLGCPPRRNPHGANGRRLPPFAECAEDGGPSVLLVSTNVPARLLAA